MSELLVGLDAYPAYYAHMGPANAAGPSGPDLSAPRRAEAAELRRRIEAGEWVVDLRARRAFAAGHVAGTLSFDLDGSFATYLGWLIPWGTPLTLLGHTAEQVAEAQRELVRIGIDHPAAAATGHPGDWAGGRPCAATRSRTSSTWSRSATTVRWSSWTSAATRNGTTRHITGAVHIPIHQLPARLAEVPAGEVWVHCAAGYRASVAASFLDAAGRTVVAVDDEYARAARPAADRRPAGARGGDITTSSTYPMRSGESPCAAPPSALAARRSPGAVAAPTPTRSWPVSPRRSGVPVPETRTRAYVTPPRPAAAGDLPQACGGRPSHAAACTSRAAASRRASPAVSPAQAPSLAPAEAPMPRPMR